MYEYVVRSSPVSASEQTLLTASRRCEPRSTHDVRLGFFTLEIYTAGSSFLLRKDEDKMENLHHGRCACCSASVILFHRFLALGRR